MARNTFESRRPPRNKAENFSFWGRTVFIVRRILDLQLHTVVRDITPWLATRHGNILDVGCGDQPYRSILSKNCEYRGLEWEGASTNFSMGVMQNKDIFYFDGGKFPFSDKSFDSLLHTEVLEHVKDFNFFLKECQRVIKVGGEMMLTVPFQARYHFIPHDYWRFTPSGLKECLEAAGFSNVEISPRGTDVTVAAYKAVAVFYRWAFGSILGRIVFVMLSWFIGVLLLIAHLSLLCGWGSSDDCLGYTVKAVRSGI